MTKTLALLPLGFFFCAACEEPTGEDTDDPVYRCAYLGDCCEFSGYDPEECGEESPSPTPSPQPACDVSKVQACFPGYTLQRLSAFTCVEASNAAGFAAGHYSPDQGCSGPMAQASYRLYSGSSDCVFLAISSRPDIHVSLNTYPCRGF